MKNRAVALSASAAFALLLVGSPAGAATLTLGLQEAGYGSPLGTITNVGTSGTGSISTGAGLYGTFTINDITASGNPALLPLTDLLNGSSSNTSTNTPGILNVYITSQSNTLFTGAQTFLSSFTSNNLAGGLTVTETTFLDTANGLFTGTAGGTVHQLGQANFTTIGTFLASLGLTPGSDYSITEVFTIDATHVTAGGGNANSTIDVHLSPVPIPGALPLFASGILGLVVLGRKRKKQKLESAIA